MGHRSAPRSGPPPAPLLAPAEPENALDAALALQALVAEHPRQTLAEARELLGRSRIGAEAAAVAHRTAARALRALDQPSDAAREARLAVRLAHRAGLPDREAEARVTLSLALFQAGRVRAALDEIEQAELLASGDTALLACAQHGILLERLGRLEEALARYGTALAGPLPPGDRLRVLNNRAIALAFTGRVDDAVSDLHEAIALAQAEEAVLAEAELLHNLGFALTVAGDLPAALSRFDQADDRFRSVGAPIGLNLVARARALARANLHREAREAAQAAVESLRAGGASAEVAEARVLLASAELADGEAAGAVATAELARRALQRQGRRGLAAQAEHVVVRARTALGRRDRRTVALAVRCADALAAAGLVAEELDARLTAGLVARDLGEVDTARRCLDAVRAHRDRGPLVERARAWQAEAISRLDEGDRAGARRAVAAGLDAVADLQGLMGATELRVGAAGHGAALAELGLRIALDDADPWQVLELLDRWRGASLVLPPVAGGGGAGPDASMVEDLTALRSAAARLEHAVTEGEDPAPARRAIAELEVRVRTRARQAIGGRQRTRLRLDAGALHARLGSSHLLVYFELDGRLGVAAVHDGRTRLVVDLGVTRQRIDSLIGGALFALRRLARPGTPEPSRRAAQVSLEDALARLDDALLAPLFAGSSDGDGSPIVICPTGPLHALPWSALPSCDGRAVSVVPSLKAIGAPATPLAGGEVVLAAGPGLAGAGAELAALATVYPGARSFGPTASSVDAVLVALEGAEIAHLACHGSFRVDNPMFSSLQLADGPLTVFDLEKLHEAPRLVVLAACDVGTAAVSAGDELLGLGAALHRAGTESVVASLVPVPDEAAVAMMVALHREVAAGEPVAVALARARQAITPDRPEAVAVRSAFTCFGLG